MRTQITIEKTYIVTAESYDHAMDVALSGDVDPDREKWSDEEVTYAAKEA